MTQHPILMAGAFSLGLALSAVSAANAHPSGKGANYGPRPPAAASKTSPAKCDCPTVKGDAAMRDRCMSMMDAHQASPRG
ncbi:MAG: hypothetical protein ACI9LT_003229 [Pseudoalteromonas distincta]|jgi:hypothetical protein